MPFVIYSFTTKLAANGCQALVETEFEALDLVVFGLEVIAWTTSANISKWARAARAGEETYSLKNALAICSIKMCG